MFTRALKFGLPAVLLIAGLLGYALLYTPLGVRFLARDLTKHGLNLRGLKGGIIPGLHLDRIRFENDSLAVDLNDVRLTFGSPFGRKTLLEASVQSAKVKWKLGAPNLATATAIPTQLPTDFDFLLNRANVQGLELETTTGARYKIDRVYISKLDLRPQVFHVERVYVQSAYVDFNLQEFALYLNPRGFRFEGAPLNARIQPAVAPEWLRSAVDVTFSAAFQDGKLEFARLQSLRQKLKLDFEHGKGDLKISDLNFSEFFKTETPLKNFQMQISGDLLHLGDFKTKGAFDVRERHFEMNKLAFLREEKSATYMIVPQFLKWRMALAGTEKLFLLTSKRHEPVRETLAQLYYAKPLTEILPEQVAVVEHDSRYFSEVATAPTATLDRSAASLAPKSNH